jgi:hypothetical protein
MHALKSNSKSSRHGLMLSFLLCLCAIGPGLGCDSDDADPVTATPDATAPAIAPRQMATPTTGPRVEPDDSCLARCLRQWQTCSKSRKPRPGAPLPAEDDCAVAAGQCVSACPAADHER